MRVEKRPACDATYQLECENYCSFSLTCDDDAGHADEPGSGDQHHHYNRARNLYWLEGLPPTPRHVARETEG